MTEKQRKIWHLFHTLWSKAVGTKDYNKEEWIELEKVITNHFRVQREVV